MIDIGIHLTSKKYQHFAAGLNNRIWIPHKKQPSAHRHGKKTQTDSLFPAKTRWRTSKTGGSGFFSRWPGKKWRPFFFSYIFGGLRKWFPGDVARPQTALNKYENKTCPTITRPWTLWWKCWARVKCIENAPESGNGGKTEERLFLKSWRRRMGLLLTIF